MKTIAALEGITPGRVIVFLHMGRLKGIRRCRKWEITGKAYKAFAALPRSSQIKPELDEEIRSKGLKLLKDGKTVGEVAN